MKRFLFKNCLIFLVSCSSVRTSQHTQELTPTKQKQKIALLQKKLQLAEKEYGKLKIQIDRLSDEMRETELAYIRKQIDEFEDLIRKHPSKKADFDSADLFLEEREKLHRMILGNESPYEAQIVLDRILQLITELSDQMEF